MNWLTSRVLPKLRALARSRVTEDNLWHACPACSQMTYRKELEQNLRVCPHCDLHLRLPAPLRLASLFDGGEYEVIPALALVQDPLKFRDTRRYVDRLKEARARSGTADAMLAATGRIGERPAVALVQDFAFMGGSMGIAVGGMVVAAAMRACQERVPLIAFVASGGARMQEGIHALMQMPRTVVAIRRLRENRLPLITVFTDPTTGGVTASFAMLGDIHIAEPGALIGFAGPRVIEQTVREELPEGFQRAEYLLAHGMIDMVVHRHQLKERLQQLLSLLERPPAPMAGGDLAPPSGGDDAALPGSGTGPAHREQG